MDRDSSHPPPTVSFGDNAPPLKRGQAFETSIDRLAFGGAGVGRAPDGRVAFVEGALPGDTVRACCTKIKRGFVEASTETVLTASPERRPARCRHFGLCGGCRLQELSYPAQVLSKGLQVAEALEHIGRLRDVTVRPPIPAVDEWHYRNKMEFAFGSGTGGELVLGLHQRGRFDRLVDLAECPLLDERVGPLLEAVRAWSRSEALEPYDSRPATGLLRYLVVRLSRSTGQAMVDLVTTSLDPPHPASFVEAVRGVLPEATVVHTTHRGRATAYLVESQEVLAGPGVIEERLGRWRFQVSPGSFFQTNPRMAERLYEVAAEAAALTGRERVVDLYCGTGTIGLTVSPFAKEVVGLEVNETAVRNAQRNAELNEVEAISFVAAPAETGIGDVLTARGPFEVAIVDPPRAGLHPKARAALTSSSVSRIAYVSCNPATLARDLEALAEERFAVEWVQPVDMFPHTPHVESVAALSRKA